jgi:hypothetical protein
MGSTGGAEADPLESMEVEGFPIAFSTHRVDERDADGSNGSEPAYCSVSFTFSVVKNSMTSPGFTSL